MHFCHNHILNRSDHAWFCKNEIKPFFLKLEWPVGFCWPPSFLCTAFHLQGILNFPPSGILNLKEKFFSAHPEQYMSRLRRSYLRTVRKSTWVLFTPKGPGSPPSPPILLMRGVSGCPSTMKKRHIISIYEIRLGEVPACALLCAFWCVVKNVRISSIKIDKFSLGCRTGGP